MDAALTAGDDDDEFEEAEVKVDVTEVLRKMRLPSAGDGDDVEEAEVKVDVTKALRNMRLPTGIRFDDLAPSQQEELRRRVAKECGPDHEMYGMSLQHRRVQKC
ncbi:hypothetical protein GOP47_0012705 [Adiantum capillus-veneris]|uniref:Uncharacterized protein n=1 Tax=Adiantum capillus-veneris TaxID=13818 RepID=A0A9D4URM2_ADICA|nr:hypothetical protein GOP47_0012705 [Adiantum capillus-veneris]